MALRYLGMSCTHCESLPACEMVTRILSENECEETSVDVPFTRPDAVFRGAGNDSG